MAALLSSFSWSEDKQPDRHIVISKQRFLLSVVEGTDTVWQVPIGVGLNYGNKQRSGDKRTPEGTFPVKRVLDSRFLTHDLGDGAGPRKGVYGPWFITLDVPGYIGIGIHGTCFPESIGTRCTEGCVRMLNSDIEKLVEMVFVGMKCTIEPD